MAHVIVNPQGRPYTPRQLGVVVYPSADERARISLGIQCPECHSVQVTARQSRFHAQPEGFSCDGCGCQWGRDYYA